MKITLNGQPRVFQELEEGATVSALLAALELKQDRVAIELNGVIAARKTWDQTPVSADDRVELVHFVGGGSETFCSG